MNKLNKEYLDCEEKLYFVFIADGKIEFEENKNYDDLEVLIVDAKIDIIEIIDIFKEGDNHENNNHE